MAKRKGRDPTLLDRPDVMKFLELRFAIVQHGQALKAVCDLLAKGKTENAIARLDQAVTALGAVVRGQAVGVTMPCPACGAEQDVSAWVDAHECANCHGPLVWPEDDT